MFIYKTTNLKNQKIYIGQTSKSEEEEYLGSGLILLKAIKKYGKEVFSREIIEFCENKKKADIQEKYWIKFYSANTREIGYNISQGGNGGNLGDEVNRKISDAIKKGGWLIGNQHLKGKIPYNKGISMPEEQKEKLRKPKSEEHKLNLSRARKGIGSKLILCLNNNIIYSSITNAAQELGLTAPNITAVLKGRAKSTKKYIFEYI